MRVREVMKLRDSQKVVSMMGDQRCHAQSRQGCRTSKKPLNAGAIDVSGQSESPTISPRLSLRTVLRTCTSGEVGS